MVMRVWRELKIQKRSGQEHGIDKHFPDRAPGSVVVPCFRCPEPGFNMDESDMDDEEIKYNIYSFSTLHGAEISYRHATTLFLSADGHFGLVQKTKNNDPDDISFTEGKGFFPLDGPYQEYIKLAGESTEVCFGSALSESAC